MQASERMQYGCTKTIGSLFTWSWLGVTRPTTSSSSLSGEAIMDIIQSSKTFSGSLITFSRLLASVVVLAFGAVLAVALDLLRVAALVLTALATLVFRQ
jgi:hypothetical protein